MGNQHLEKKRGRKKGRPSLLDLQKRSLRLQKQQEDPNPNPNPSNPYLRFPSRRGTPDPDLDDDEDDGSGKKKKLKHVLRLSGSNSASASDADPDVASGDESDGGARKKRRIAGDLDTPSSKAIEDATPLPDKKLLVLVLDRLQKKDSYGVYAEPVDPEELPDYHDIIKNPMDFGTVRRKLADGAYANLEQFENDVFLICSNAMQYNSADTIYYRQARSISELAKKDFESLRQESDDNEPGPKRRGRPPTKNIFKRTVGRPPAERTGSDFSSDATLANARENGHWANFVPDPLRKGSVLDRPSTAGVFTRASNGVCFSERRSWASEQKSERSEEYSGSLGRGAKMKYGRNSSVIDENRRNTYLQPQNSASFQEPSVLNTFSGERKLLVPVGLHMEQAYARSLAMFAADLGPVAWEVAAKKIERVLPPGTRFGSGWVGDSEIPQHSQNAPFSTSTPPHLSSQPSMAKPPIPTSMSSFVGVAREDEHSVKQEPTGGKPAPDSHHIRGFSSDVGSISIRPKNPLQLHQNSLNGFNTTHGYNLLSQVEKMGRQASPLGVFGHDPAMMTHARALDLVSRGNNSFTSQGSSMGQMKSVGSTSFTPQGSSMGQMKSVGSTSAVPATNPLQEMERDRDAQAQWRESAQNPKPGLVPPDLNVGFQSSGSPVSGTPMDSQQPDLMLQL